MDELRNRLQKAETASVEYQRQLAMLQARLDESLRDHERLEERIHEGELKINDLEDEKVHTIRQRREMENHFEAERAAMLQDKDERKAKEEEQHSVIQRLKETLAHREFKVSADEERGVSRSCKSNTAQSGKQIKAFSYIN